MNTTVKPTNQGRVPILLVYVSTVSQLFVLFVALVGVLISLLAGNSVWRMVIQVAIGTLVVGGCVWGINKIISQALLAATLERMKQEAEKEAEEAAAKAAAEAYAAAAAAAAEAAAAEENSDVFETELQL